MPIPREACPFDLAPTTSTTALLALGDALAIVLLKAHGFEQEDYGKLHPAGVRGLLESKVWYRSWYSSASGLLFVVLSVNYQ